MDGLLTVQGKYTPRKPRKTAYYHLVENHFEQLESEWEELYQPKYGFWREHVMDVIYKYLDCGDPKHGFARVKCQDCNHEYNTTSILLPTSGRTTTGRFTTPLASPPKKDFCLSCQASQVDHKRQPDAHFYALSHCCFNVYQVLFFL
jgi:hypothetical protein